MRQRRALSLQAAILNKKNEELMFEEKEEPEEEQEKQVVIKEVIVEKKVETATVEVQTDRVVISEYVEPPKITVSTIQKLKSRGKKAKQVEEKEEEVLPLHKGMELVTLVYEEKLQQDIRDEGKHIEPQDLKQFCRDVLIRKYGIQSLAKKNMRALLASTREGAGRSLSDTLIADYRACQRFMTPPSDFFEGIRAALVDKDRNPQWQPRELADVTDAALAEYFGPPAGGDLIVARRAGFRAV